MPTQTRIPPSAQSPPMLLPGDAVRPSEVEFKAVYERGYRMWTTLWEKAMADKHLPQHRLTDLWLAFPNHPYFPKDLKLESFSNTVIVRGKTTWATSKGPCDLSPFQEDVILNVASSCVTTIVFVPDPHPATRNANFFGSESNHVPILMLAWAYILSARWAELIPGACPPTYDNHEHQSTAGSTSRGLEDEDSTVVVDVGDVDGDAARWWTAVLSADGGGWDASIRSDKGFLLCAPWSIKTQPGHTFAISANIRPRSHTINTRTASSSAAIRYLSEYCFLHDVADQSQAGLAAALLIPMARQDNRRIHLPIPRLSQEGSNWQQRKQTVSAWDGGLCPLDRLLTLSCNSRGLRSLLNSVFFDPGVDCNVCGAWLQGSFAFLDSEKAKDPRLRLLTLINRDPTLGFLWLGAFITGADARCLQEARAGWWKVDLSAAAWTGTHVSFIQGSALKASAATHQISRADECRLMYLSHEQAHAIQPLFPFAPFGSTALEDADLDVRRHVQCSAVHGLIYDGFTWDCNNGRKVYQGIEDVQAATIRSKATQPPRWNSSATVIYDNMDTEDEVSEMITRNVFTWLRGDDGFPAAERAIREHEWIENLESDDDSPIEGDVRSTAGGKLGGWLLGVSTSRSNSI